MKRIWYKHSELIKASRKYTVCILLILLNTIVFFKGFPAMVSFSDFLNSAQWFAYSNSVILAAYYAANQVEKKFWQKDGPSSEEAAAQSAESTIENQPGTDFEDESDPEQIDV